MSETKYTTSNGKDNSVTHRDVTDDVVDVRCGYGNCKPEILQKFNTPKILLLFLCIFVVTQGFVVNGVNNVNTQSIERRFRLPSSKSGLISSSYDFSAAVIGVFISFFGSGRNKYRWLTAGAISLGLGSFTMAIPHFTTGLYEWGQDVTGETCNVNGTNIVEEKCISGSLQDYLGVLMFGMILHGVGGCIAYTVGVGFLDDSVTAEKSPLYLGFFYGAAALGPGLGYIVGGQMLNIYVDFDKVDTSTINLSTDDPRWVGAWWAAFFFSVVISFLVAIPLSCFGAELPTARFIRESRVSQMHKGIDEPDEGKGTSQRLPVKEFPKATLALLKNAPFVFTMLAGATEGILTSGFATFVPKYIQNHFSVSSGAAAMYTGVAAVPGAAGGMFFGGLICSKLKLKVKGMFKFSIITCIITIVFMNFLWISCDEDNFAGVSTAYPNGTQSLVDTCNSDCSCDTRYFSPVCSGGVQYFSACHAGCRTSLDGQNYSNCACAVADPVTNVSMVTPGLCKSGCGMMYLFLVLLFFVIFITFLPSTPSDAATLRCIHADHRTFSMGLKWLFIRLLGTVPGPIIFGAVTDTACRVWQTECGEQSSCWIYDNFAVSRNYFLLAMAAKALSMTFFLLAYCLYKPPDHSLVPVSTEGRDEAKKQMAFENGSFRASEYEGSVLGVSKKPHNDRTTQL